MTGTGAMSAINPTSVSRSRTARARRVRISNLTYSFERSGGCTAQPRHYRASERSERGPGRSPGSYAGGPPRTGESHREPLTHFSALHLAATRCSRLAPGSTHGAGHPVTGPMAPPGGSPRRLTLATTPALSRVSCPTVARSRLRAPPNLAPAAPALGRATGRVGLVGGLELDGPIRTGDLDRAGARPLVTFLPLMEVLTPRGHQVSS